MCGRGTHQPRLAEQQLHGGLAGSSPAGGAHLVEDVGDGRVVSQSHSITLGGLFNELEHGVLQRAKHRPVQCATESQTHRPKDTALFSVLQTPKHTALSSQKPGNSLA